MSTLYSDIKTEISDRVNSAYFSDVNQNEILRATNHALRDINIGRLTEDPKERGSRLVGYDWQRAELDVSYVSGTKEYTLASISSSMKFVDDVIVKTDENQRFTQATPRYFRRRIGVNNSNELMWATEFTDSIPYLLVNYYETDTLQAIYFTSNMVSISGVASPKFQGDDNESLLMPDTYADAVIDIAVGYLSLRDRNERSRTSQTFLTSGRSVALALIKAHGKRQTKPIDNLDVRNEWGAYDLHR